MPTNYPAALDSTTNDDAFQNVENVRSGKVATQSNSGATGAAALKVDFDPSGSGEAYPTKGLIIVAPDDNSAKPVVIRYTAVSASGGSPGSFTIATSGRGLYNTTDRNLLVGERVALGIPNEHHNAHSNAIIQLETKVGIGTSTPAAGTAFRQKTGGTITEWASMPFAEVRHSVDQTITTATLTILDFDTDVQNAYGMHFTSNANLTGTLAKTASSTAVVGTSTLFLSELSVGQVISIPGTAAEKRVVTAIADNTHLTVASNFANTASGQTAKRVNSALVAVEAGFYVVNFVASYEANATGRRSAGITANDQARDLVWAKFMATTDATKSTDMSPTRSVYLNKWDFVEVIVLQASGTSLKIFTADGYSLIFTLVKVAG